MAKRILEGFGGIGEEKGPTGNGEWRKLNQPGAGRGLLRGLWSVVLMGMTVALLFGVPSLGASPWMANTKTLAADEANQYNLAIAYNPNHDEYVVVWQEDNSSGIAQVFGIRVDGEGAPIGSPSVISPVNGLSQFNPDVAYDPVNDGYFVVWSFDFFGNGSDFDISGKFIAWDDLVNGQAFAIDGRGGYQNKAALSYSSDSMNFLVVYQDDISGATEITGCLVPADGGDMGGFVNISGGSGGFRDSRVAFNAQSGKYLVVYDGPPSDACGIAVIGRQVFELSMLGLSVGPEINISSASYLEGAYPDVAACRGSYLVSWSTADNGQGQYYWCSRQLSDQGVLSPIAHCSTALNHSWVSTAVSCNEGSNEYLFTWAEEWAGTDWASMAVVGAYVDTEGTQGEDFIIYLTPDDFDYEHPQLAIGKSGKALVAWESDRPPDSSSRDIRGRLVGDRLFADGFESGDDWWW